MDLVGKPNTTSPIWNHLHSCHPSAFVQVSSSARDRKCPAGQVCIGEAFSKLAKYERDSGKWKMLTRNVTTYPTIPIPHNARAADKELTCPLAWWRSIGTWTGWVCLQDIWTLCQYVINGTRQFTVRDLLYRTSGVDRITDYNGFALLAWGRQGHGVYLTFLFKATFLCNLFIWCLVYCGMSVYCKC